MGLKHGKFVATQVSAGLVGFACVFGVGLLARRLFPGFWVELNMMKSILFGAFFITVLVASMVLWGKVLVWLGVLTKGEAKGYPYARPWEKNELDGTIDRLIEREAKQSSAGDAQERAPEE